MGDRIVKGQGRTQVRLEALDTGNGICLCLTGGEAPHVGGVVLAAPRPSLTGQGNSCDLWTATVPGHKDVYLAQKAAGKLCTDLQVNVSATVGIHIDGAQEQELEIIGENAMEALDEYIAAVKSRRETDGGSHHTG